MGYRLWVRESLTGYWLLVMGYGLENSLMAGFYEVLEGNLAVL